MTEIDKLFRLNEVEEIVGFKKSKLYLMVAEGSFPAPLRLGKRSIRWKASDIYKWIESISDKNRLQQPL